MKTTLRNVSLVALLLILGLAVPVEAGPRRIRNDARAKPATAEVTDQGVNHVVQVGETLFSIAEKYYGNGVEWVRLKEYNPWVDEDRLNIGEIISIPDPRRVPRDAVRAPGSRTSPNPPPSRSLFGWVPSFGNLSFFGRTVPQLLGLVLAWFVAHFSIQGVFVWFAAHLAFVKDVNLKKAMRATLQSESLALICIIMAAVVGYMLLYIGTTSPGKPLTSELLTTAEDYLGSTGGMASAGILLVALYAFLGIRFIPPAFGIQAGRAVTVVVIAILLPHLIGAYLLGHRMGLIE